MGTSATDFTSISSPNNSIGTIFTATGSGTGNGTAYLLNSLDPFTSTVQNGKNVAPLLSSSSIAADGKTLTLNFTRSLDTGRNYIFTFNVEKYNSATSQWSSVDASYLVDGDSSVIPIVASLLFFLSVRLFLRIHS